MKRLTDSDIANMIGTDFYPDDLETKKSVRKSLHLSNLIPPCSTPTPKHITIDFHQHTEEEAWAMLTDAVESGAREITVITGASGILKTKFQQWATESIISPRVMSFRPINNGSFLLKTYKNQKKD